jgi:hypothetical protein
MQKARRMKRVSGIVAVVLLVVPVVACLPSEVVASDYDQTCAKDDDCVAVNELHTDGSECSMECNFQAINKKEQTRFDEDLAESLKSCGSRASPFCEMRGKPACVQGRCAIKPE